MQFKNIKIWAFLATAFVACQPEMEVPTATKGSADFTKYVAIGNSLTAGFADGGLYREGQLVSYPNLIAQQLKLVGGGEFNQPLFSESQANGSGYLKLKGFTALGLPNLAQETSNLAIRGVGEDKRTFLYTKYDQSINNLGVPGIAVANLNQAGYGYNNPLGFNPYFERMLPSTVPAAVQKYSEFAEASNPTFFSCWLGNNDVLGYATSGGVGQITPDALFQANFTDIINRMTAKGAKGVVANIPDVTTIPFFSVLTVESLKAQVKASTGLSLDVYIQTKTGNRVATSEDLLTINTLQFVSDSLGKPSGLDPNGRPILKGLHPFAPIGTRYVLDKDEIATAKAAVQRFNGIIAAAAQAKGLALVDAFTFVNGFKGGKVINGVSLSTAFIAGGIFSLDGVHMTPKGNAVAANEFIKAINQTYSANIPLLDISKYAGVMIKP